jgi:mono/diheme cytochrome c family protein
MNLALWALMMIAADTPAVEHYTSHVKPLLAAKCLACHGAVKQEGGLRLDTARLAGQGGENGPVLLPHDEEGSTLLSRVTEKDETLRMPPADAGTRLTPDEVGILAKWIEQGGAGPDDEVADSDPKDHWAFHPPLIHSTPTETGDVFADGMIDAFLRRDQRSQGVDPLPDAPPAVWLRRVYLDLLGLLPSLDQIIAFEQESRADARDRVVDQLLASPAHGERWARHWMDIWRYSDWWGLGPDVRNSQKHVWHWRDWMVESLNAGVGYGEMVRQMLAGDELYPSDPDKLRATGFLVRHYFKFNRNTWMEETVEHTSKAFLGLTMNCARCHDHKYDPISQVDYYRFRAHFEPYQVRTDQVPGQIDYEKDGMPRAYDCHLETPTFLFAQGDEARPVKEQSLSPGLPTHLTMYAVQQTIHNVALPRDAYRLSLRPWVAENHRRHADAQSAQAETEWTESRDRVRAWIKATDPAKRTLLAEDHFDSLQESLWRIDKGNWEIVDHQLRQSATNPSLLSAALVPALPADVELSVRLTIHGGERWRSAGIAFDVAEGNRLAVYLSACQGESKLQVYYQEAGVDHYHAEGAQSRVVPINKPIEVRIRLRGPLVNVVVDGQLAVAYVVPVPRNPGRMELFTYDAQASFDDLIVMALPTEMELAEPGKSAVPISIDEALDREEVARAHRDWAQKERSALEARIAADQSMDDPALMQLASQRQAEAKMALAEKAWKAARHHSKGLKDTDRHARISAALAELDRVRDEAKNPSPYKPLLGAVKAPESSSEPAESLERSFPAESSGRRSALVHWMVDGKNPLFARVAINHLWNRHWGQPLVRTVFDWGRKGAKPTHPELLDTLARDFVADGFEMKSLHRAVVTSHAYRLTSRGTAPEQASRSVDASNKLYWHAPSKRMEAEVIRDTLVDLAGELNREMLGPTVDPAKEPFSSRRSLYFTHSHNERHRFLEVFDSASERECYVRSASIIPQQALALSNSKLVIEATEKIARRLNERSLSDDHFVENAWLLLLGVRPSDEERQACLEAMKDWKVMTPTATELGVGMPIEEARARLVHSLINHDEFIMIH